MNYQEFQEAKATFQYTKFLEERKPIERLRKDFVKRFTPEKIRTMKLDEYVQGKQSTKSFCYGVEWELDRMGRIVGSTCIKFGIYWSDKDQEYKFAKRFGATYQEAFKTIKQCILDLLEAGKADDYQALEDNLLSPMFKGKILSIYYPNKYLNIFSDEHLDHYLKGLDLDTADLLKKDAIHKRTELLKFKNNDKDMVKWSIDMFSMFLVYQYPKEPKAQKDQAFTPNSSVELKFPTVDQYSFIDLSLAPKSTEQNGRIAVVSKGKPDYEKEEKRKTKLGDRGEKIVMMAEVERVLKENSVSKAQAEKMVIRKSLESDAIGYDILSVNPDGSPRHIEVKATTRKAGDMSFFYTINELEAAKKYGKDYYIYIVYEILSKEPKIWVLKNPFIGNQQLTLEPIKFKVNVRTK